MSNFTGPSQQPPPRPIFGTAPGLLDPSQAERLLRAPGAVLSFAAFDPLAASRADTIKSGRKNEELSRPKRIVIETVIGFDGGNFWRFVPRARLEPGVESEGSWPRTIEICGGLYYCSQDQWDIYKLDPEYDCLVRAAPHMTVISRKKGKERVERQDASHTWAGAVPRTPPRRKRRLSSPSSNEQPDEHFRKRFKSVVTISDDGVPRGEAKHHRASSSGVEEDEVEDIISDEFMGTPRANPFLSPGRLSGRSRTAGSHRNLPNEFGRQKRENFGAKPSRPMGNPPADETIDLTTEPDQSAFPPPPVHPSAPKRKGSPIADSYAGTGSASHPIDITDEQPQYTSYKRARTESPTSKRRELAKKRETREKRRVAQFRERANGRSQQWYQTFMNGVYAEVPEELSTPPPEETSAEPDVHAEQFEEADEEALHRTLIEESRRKLAELEKDRPLWEEAARKRREQEMAEEEARRARREEEQRRAVAAEAEARERQRQAEARASEAERRAQEDRARAEREQGRRQRQREHARWKRGPWTSQRALERYMAMCEEFDAAKFTPSDPLTFDRVPWPVLRVPTALTVEDIDWTAVETFFHTVKLHMRTQEYKTLVEKSHKRFHPDRWRARGLLKGVQDEEFRGCLEVAANTVAQALTPLWREVKNT